MSPRPALPPEEVEVRRAAILEATIDQIALRGPESVRMKDVAAGAEVSVGSVQYYFGSRDELLLAAFSHHSRAVIDAIAALAAIEGSAWARMRSSFRAVPSVEHYERRSTVWVELVAAARRNEFLQTAVAEVFDRWRAHFAGLIAAGITDGSFVPRTDADLVVDILVAQIDGFDLATASGRRTLGPEEIGAALEAAAASLLGVARKSADS